VGGVCAAIASAAAMEALTGLLRRWSTSTLLSWRLVGLREVRMESWFACELVFAHTRHAEA
jgi:hypothetical protein